MKKLLLIITFVFMLVGCDIVDPPIVDDAIIIAFETNGGDPLAARKLNELQELPTPFKEGFDFLGWYLEDTFETEANLDAIEADTTLYARWLVVTKEVTFLDYDGSVLKVEFVEVGKDATPPSDPERHGFNFVGWDTHFLNVVTDLTVTAQYQEKTKYLVSFVDFDNAILKEEYVYFGDSVTPPSNPERPNFNFVGWDGEYNNITSNRQIVAIYQLINTTFTISFDSRGGGSYQDMGVNYEVAIPELPTPVKANATFSHWIANGVRVTAGELYMFIDSVVAEAVWLENYQSAGTNVSYRNSSTRVMMPDTYTQKQAEFRGMWVTNLVENISRGANKEDTITKLTAVLDQLEAWNMNAIVYHIRMMNDAAYDTNLSPKSSYVSGINFEEWDYLEWFIEECHKRDIEFHAWLNPYRISGSATNMDAVLARYANFPLNPASKEENVIIGTSGAILNPGEPVVRQFLIDVCLEIMEKYNIDAIHFDDYFYASMPTNADLVTYNKYKASSNTTNISDWRREQVDIFIEGLSNAMRNFNAVHGRNVELGISPTGIWRNGNGIVTYDSEGNAITNGSNTAGQEHYASYLFSNTKKWIDEEWIDYICPQTYWGFTHPVAGYADVVDWWVKVVRYKDVKLYTGMGIYMALSTGTTYSWQTNPYEASDQLLYNSQFSEIQGSVIFRYGNVFTMLGRNNPGTLRMFNEYWTEKVPTP